MGSVKSEQAKVLTLERKMMVIQFPLSTSRWHFV